MVNSNYQSVFVKSWITNDHCLSVVFERQESGLQIANPKDLLRTLICSSSAKVLRFMIPKNFITAKTFYLFDS